MIINTKEDLSKYKCEFIDLEELSNELKKNPFGSVLLYIENNEIYGYLYYSGIYERAEINQFEVNEKYRNKRIGTELLKKLIKIVDKPITLEVKKTNYIAIKLYKKFAFEEKAIRKGYYNGIDGILMERLNK